ncbi:MAG: LCCL domain-containing protein [Bosea sp. (in: a-proteobacteria)]
MKVVQELVAYFDHRGKLSRKQLTKLLEQNYVASDAPNGMHGLCDTVGATFYFRIRGTLEGQVWGTDTYTRDSNLGAAAVHAGLVKPDETKVLRVTVVAALSAYPGSTNNGVTTTDYAEFPHAWRLSAI